MYVAQYISKEHLLIIKQIFMQNGFGEKYSDALQGRLDEDNKLSY